ncbi:MAG: SURF1 family protein [Rhizomicrobium sp.]
MRLTFRPLPGLTVAVALLFAGLVALGVWQLQRLQWKLALIDQVTRNLEATPVTLNGAALPSPQTDYLRVALTGRYDNANEAYVYGIGPEGAPVFHVVVPFHLDDGRVLLVDRGIVPRDMQSPATRPAGIRNGETTQIGIWRWTQAPGTFTPNPDLKHRIWYSRDAPGIGRALHLSLAAPALIEADAAPNPGGWPRGGQTVVAFRNEHLQYAITWFLMAAGLLGVYLAYHVSKGRLALTPKD